MKRTLCGKNGSGGASGAVVALEGECGVIALSREHHRAGSDGDVDFTDHIIGETFEGIFRRRLHSSDGHTSGRNGVVRHTDGNFVGLPDFSVVIGVLEADGALKGGDVGVQVEMLDFVGLVFLGVGVGFRERIVPVRANALGAGDAGVSCVARARARFVLVPERVGDAGSGRELTDGLAGSVSGAVVGANGSTARFAFVSGKAVALPRRSVAQSTVGAFHVKVSLVAAGEKVSWPPFPVSGVAGFGRGDVGDGGTRVGVVGVVDGEVVGVAVKVDVSFGGGDPGDSAHAGSQGAVGALPVGVAVAHIVAFAAPVSGARVGARRVRVRRDAEDEERRLHYFFLGFVDWFLGWFLGW